MLTVHSLSRHSGMAYARDCLRYLGIAAAIVPLGLIAYRKGCGKKQPVVLAASAVPPVVSTVVAARQESGSTQATPGKRRHGLTVRTANGQSLSFGQALVRNSVKIAIPWQLGHTVAVGAAFGGFDEQDPLTTAATLVTYPLLAVLIGSVLLGDGRALHDRVAGSKVLLVAEDHCGDKPDAGSRPGAVRPTLRSAG